jgi:hypothetical protein
VCFSAAGIVERFTSFRIRHTFCWFGGIQKGAAPCFSPEGEDNDEEEGEEEEEEEKQILGWALLMEEEEVMILILLLLMMLVGRRGRKNGNRAAVLAGPALASSSLHIAGGSCVGVGRCIWWVLVIE